MFRVESGSDIWLEKIEEEPLSSWQARLKDASNRQKFTVNAAELAAGREHLLRFSFHWEAVPTDQACVARCKISLQTHSFQEQKNVACVLADSMPAEVR